MLKRLAIFVMLLAWVPAGSGTEPQKSTQKNLSWVGTWASSPQLGDDKNGPPSPGFEDSTLRQIVHVSVGGSRLRVRFSNAFGTTALTIPSAHIALAGEASKIQPETDRPITFHGQESVTIPAGALMVSDPLNFHLPPLSSLTITIYLKQPPEGITAHPGSRTTSFVQSGNTVSAPDMHNAASTDHWYFINGVDVEASRSAAAVVILGDSITDGRGSTANKNDRWTDGLARRLLANKRTNHVGVLNQGIGGNRLLRDGLGPNTLARLDRDVLAQTGVRWLIVLEGINDIGTRVSTKTKNEEAATADDMIAAYQQIILRAHAHNIRVYGATILPFGDSFYFTPDGEADRQKVNQWIRASGAFDGVIDFDQVTRDPAAPSHLAAASDSGDHLHPGAAGYRIMSDSVDLGLFTN